MTREEKLVAIGRFESAYGLVAELVEGLPDEALAFVPEVKDAWPVREHLVHLLDSECAVYFRLRLAIAEPGSVVQMWDEVAWHEKLVYGSADARACLRTAMTLRSTLAASLKAKVDADWSAFWLQHPEKGRLELERLLELYREHLAFHVPYIKRNVDAWKAAKA